MKLPNNSYSWSYHKKDYGDGLMVHSQIKALQFSESCQNNHSRELLSKINEMQHKLQCRCPALVNRKGPILLQWKCSIIHCTTNAPEVELIRLQNCLIQHIHSTFQWLTTTYSSIAKISCNEKSPTSKLQQKMPSKNPLLPELHNSMLLE